MFRKRSFSFVAVFVLFAVMLLLSSPSLAGGATQISGTAEFAEEGECTDSEGAGAVLALDFDGDLDGCFYVFPETGKCTPSGVYLETGKDLFVGNYNGGSGTFWMTYRFEGKFEDCPNLVGEVFGRCQHPIMAGTGTVVFENATGRLGIKDDVAADGTVTFRYEGHLRW
jgi:hypothetical protein